MPFNGTYRIYNQAFTPGLVLTMGPGLHDDFPTMMFKELPEDAGQQWNVQMDLSQAGYTFQADRPNLHILLDTRTAGEEIKGQLGNAASLFSIHDALGNVNGYHVILNHVEGDPALAWQANAENVTLEVLDNKKPSQIWYFTKI